MDFLSYAGYALSLIIMGFNAAMFIVIKFNDFAHMEKKLENITTQLIGIDKKLDSTTERIAKIEGRLQ